MKRFALKRFVAGDAGLAFLCNELSAVLSGDLINTNIIPTQKSMYFANTSGSFIEGTIVNDGLMLSDKNMQRDYSINNPEIIEGGTDLRMRAPSAQIIDCTQFGNFAFHITDETTIGTSFYLSGTILGDEIWYVIPHEIVTYTAGSIGNIDKIIQKLSFDYSEEGSAIFGNADNELYVKTIPGANVYGSTMQGSISLPFTYMLEQPLNLDSIKIYSTVEGAYGSEISPFSGYLYCKNALINNPNIYSEFAIIEINDHILVNPFNLKNIYDPNWQTPINSTDNTLKGIRDYIRVGSAQETLWMSYIYIHEDGQITQDYEFIERVRGFYKYKQTGGHKSNMFSIQINNSGLNKKIKNIEIQKALQELVEDALFSAIKKVAPAHTALFKVKWTGQ